MNIHELVDLDFPTAGHSKKVLNNANNINDFENVTMQESQSRQKPVATHQAASFIYRHSFKILR